jgi:2-polyprenyl-3-methyl-5-hydroxy-6-metoxy-1,4-benzoquinol methylase
MGLLCTEIGHQATAERCMRKEQGMAKENVTQAGIAWQKRVENEHAQSDRVREEVASDDFWRPVAHRFVPSKKGESDPDDTVERLTEFLVPGDTSLDVGAGGGRLVVPLAEHCASATAVEPSEAMREQLLATAEAWDVRNISVIASTWEDAVVDPHIWLCVRMSFTPSPISKRSFVS